MKLLRKLQKYPLLLQLVSEALQQLPEKSLNAFNRILDSICEEEKNDSKDESR